MYLNQFPGFLFFFFFIYIYPVSLLFIIQKFIHIFSSPQPKAHMPFSDQNLLVVHRRHCHKQFTFSSHSPEPLDQFQQNLARSILG